MTAAMLTLFVAVCCWGLYLKAVREARRDAPRNSSRGDSLATENELAIRRRYNEQQAAAKRGGNVA